MALSLVTLAWNVTDLIQAGIPAALVITPTAPLIDVTDGSEVAVYPRLVNFRNGTGQLAGIVANDSADVLPQGTGYAIVITAWTGEVIYSQTVKILIANGASQRLADLTPVESVVAMEGFVPLTGGQLLGALIPSVATLADAPTVAVNAAAGNDFRLSLGGNRTLGTPAAPSDGQRITILVTSNGFSLAYSAAYNFGTAGTPVLPAGKTILGFLYDAGDDEWLGVPPALGY